MFSIAQFYLTKNIYHLLFSSTKIKINFNTNRWNIWKLCFVQMVKKWLKYKYLVITCTHIICRPSDNIYSSLEATRWSFYSWLLYESQFPIIEELMEPNCLLQIKVGIGYNIDQNFIQKFKNNKIRANICGIQILAISILITRGPWGHIAHIYDYIITLIRKNNPLSSFFFFRIECQVWLK